jgi:nucleoside-diphosphate-sugar epimerase
MKIFLTGGTGFIGSHFLNLAMKEGHELLVLKRSKKSVPRVDLINDPSWLNKEIKDVTAEDLKGIDVILHLAAHSANVPYDRLDNCMLKNVLEPLALFERAAEAGVGKFVVAGSCFEYGQSGERYDFIPVSAPLEPTQTYPASKALASTAFYQFAIENKVQLSYHRIFQVFGKGELETRLWPSLRRAAKRGEDFEMTKGEQVRDFVEVEQVALKFLEAVQDIFTDNSLNPKFRNIGSGRPQSILEFSKYWWSKWEAKGSLVVGVKEYRQGEIMRYVPEI